jgi:hypothetical protein
MYKKTTSTTWLYKNITTCTAPTTVLYVDLLDSVSTYQFASLAVNDIGTGPTTDAATYETKTTYGKPSTPARPTLV